MTLSADGRAPDALSLALDELRSGCAPIVSSTGQGRGGRIPFPSGVVSIHVVVQGDWLIDAAIPLWRRWLERGELVVVNGRVEGALRPASGVDRAGSVLSMRLNLDAPHGHPLLESLPPLIRTTPGGAASSLGLCMHALLDELPRRIPGREAITRHLCEVLFVQALRSHLADLSWNDQGWFRVLADPLLRDHIAAPAGSSVSRLASAAFRSTRSIRARFTRIGGGRLSTFLRSARIRSAARLLREGEADLARIAALTGYGSRQALARAFRQQLGVSPTEYWRKSHRRPFPRGGTAGSGAPDESRLTSVGDVEKTVDP